MARENPRIEYYEEYTALHTYLSDADAVIKEKTDELKSIIIPDPGGLDTDAVWQQVNAANAAKQRLNAGIDAIETTLDSPYFRRFDVSSNDETYVIYVGDQPASFGEHTVYQWQQAGEKPMLDFLMQGAREHTFTDRGGIVHKRMRERGIEIRRRKLIDVSEDYVSDSEYARLGINDPFLIGVIKRRRAAGAEISNIISTVQRNQYDIIRYPANQSFVVQGCAGSGKTYIMLNRLSYLLFNKQTTHLTPEDVIVISPNPHIQHQLSKAIDKLSVKTVRHTKIEDWYLELLQQFSLYFDNSLIMPESSLPVEYENAVFSEAFQQEVCAAVQAERNRLYALADELFADQLVLSWGRVRGILPARSPDPSDKIAFIHLIDKESRSVEKKYRDFCKENEISEDLLDAVMENDDATDALLSEIADIDAKVSAILKYEPLFEEYQAASELLEEENASFERRRDEVCSELQVSLDRLREIGAMTSEERTTFLTRHLRLESESALFEGEGAAIVFHEEQVRECREMMDAAWLEMLQKLPMEYRTDPVTAKDDMRRHCETLLEKKAGLQERYNAATSSTSRQRANQERALALRAALLPKETAQKVSACARQTTSLPLRARDVTADLMRKLKHKYSIAIVDSGNNDAGVAQQRRVLYRSDLYMFLYAAVLISQQSLSLSWKLICFDEAQDISSYEFSFIQKMAPRTICFNIYGDILQGRDGCYSTTQEWQASFPTYPVFLLNENYRNAQQITKEMNRIFSTKMLAIGVDGFVSTVQQKDRRKALFGFINSCSNNSDPNDSGSNGWIIVRDKETFLSFLSTMGIMDQEGVFSFDLTDTSKRPIVLTIDQVKGVEFPRVLVITDGMDKNQKYIAMTRALSELYIL